MVTRYEVCKPSQSDVIEKMLGVRES